MIFCKNNALVYKPYHGFKPVLIAAYVLALSVCSTHALAENRDLNATLDFALIGDTPYHAEQRKEYVAMMQEIDAANLAFVAHAGDFWFDGIGWKDTTKGLPPCSDEVFIDRLQLANNSRHPFILTPGDNDWTDCFRAKPRAYDPLERLAKMRKMFFASEQSLGKRPMQLTRQSADFPENLSWTYGGVQFVTLHMTGSNNNLGRTQEMDKEFMKRNAANLKWLQQAFKHAKDNNSIAIMIISQANPHFETKWSPLLQGRYLLKGLGIKARKEERATGFDDFLSVLEKETLAFDKPVVYVHGDTHTFRIDKPLVRTPNGMRFIENFTRVETFGYPNTHWIRVSIIPGDPNIFRFSHKIVKDNRVSK